MAQTGARPKRELSPEEQHEADVLWDLRGKECAGCTGPKMRGYSFCKDCFSRLPPDIKKALIRMLHPNYIPAFEEAKKLLAL